jgi:hypothetical protein
MERSKYIGFFDGYVRLMEVNETATDLNILLQIKTGTRELAIPLIESLRKEHHAIRVKRLKDIPGYNAIKRLRKKQAIEQQELERRNRIQLAVTQFKEYSQEFSSEAKALLHLIRYLNRYAKSFPKYKFASHGNQKTVSLIYSLKDQWIKKNRTLITSAVLAHQKTRTWIDWDALHFERDMTGEWQNPEYYEVSSTHQVYAYEFDIEGEVARFHSHIAVVQGQLNYDPNAMGKAQPLTQEERAAIPLMKALYLVCGGLEEDPDICNGVTDVEPPTGYPEDEWGY